MDPNICHQQCPPPSLPLPYPNPIQCTLCCMCHWLCSRRGCCHSGWCWRRCWGGRGGSEDEVMMPLLLCTPVDSRLLTPLLVRVDHPAPSTFLSSKHRRPTWQIQYGCLGIALDKTLFMYILSIHHYYRNNFLRRFLFTGGCIPSSKNDWFKKTFE
jgi:hypothetical protein